jgi:hypothetical protein
MEDNPYKSPIADDATVSAGSDVLSAGRLVRAPAISLVILASIAMLLDSAVIMNVALYDRLKILEQHGPDQGMIVVVLDITMNGLIFLVHLFVLFGAVTAAIVSLLPFCSPVVLLGIPFGIWALVVLRRHDVREAFRRNSR